MEQTYLLGLSLLDFLPSIGFLVNAVFLVRLVGLRKRPLPRFTMITGTSLVFLGGTLKAVWKLLITVGAGDFPLLSELQFVLLAPGFLLMFISLLLVIRPRKIGNGATLVGIGPWQVPLLAIMTTSSVGILGIQGYLALRRRAYGTAALFIAALICILGMAGLARGDQSITRQWIEEGVNTAGQALWAAGSIRLYGRFRSDEGTTKPAR